MLKVFNYYRKDYKHFCLPNSPILPLNVFFYILYAQGSQIELNLNVLVLSRFFHIISLIWHALTFFLIFQVMQLRHFSWVLTCQQLNKQYIVTCVYEIDLLIVTSYPSHISFTCRVSPAFSDVPLTLVIYCLLFSCNVVSTAKWGLLNSACGKFC